MTNTAKKFSSVKTLPLGIITIAAIILWVLGPPEGLAPHAWSLFVIFLATILGVIVKAMPMGALALCAMTLCIITGQIGDGPGKALTTALGSFSHPVPWLAVLAFFIARGFIKTGLGRRIAFLFIKLLGKHTLGLSYGLALTDLILAPAMPSITARGGGIVYPIVRAISESYDSRPDDESSRRIGSYLIITAFLVNITTAAMFLTAMAGNAVAVEMASKVEVTITWAGWAKAAIVPGLITLVVMPLFVYLVYPPKIKHTPEAKRFAQEHLDEMGPASASEWIMLGTFGLLITMWIGGGAWGIRAETTALLGVCILLITGVLTYEDLKAEKAAWDTLIWMSILIMLAGQLNQQGFISWLTESIQGHISGFHWVAVYLLLSLFYFYSHYLFASASAHIVAMMLPLMSLAVASGVPAHLMAMTLCVFSNLFASLTHYGIGSAPIFYGARYMELKTWWGLGFGASLVFLVIWIGVGSVWWKALGLY